VANGGEPCQREAGGAPVAHGEATGAAGREAGGSIQELCLISLQYSYNQGIHTGYPQLCGYTADFFERSLEKPKGESAATS
jgi:hypothetical protein